VRLSAVRRCSVARRARHRLLRQRCRRNRRRRQTEIETGLALAALDAADRQARLDAVAVLASD
jgi:hypothetical protein